MLEYWLVYKYIFVSKSRLGEEGCNSRKVNKEINK